MKYFVRTDGGEEAFDIYLEGDTVTVRRGDRMHVVDVSQNEFKPYIHLLIDNRSFLVTTNVRGEIVEVEALEGAYTFEVLGEKRRELERLGLRKKKELRKKDVHAPMPGLVVAVQVEAGQEVKRGQGIAIVEAMKMENELRAADSGVVKEVLVKEGQRVDQNQLLVVIE